MYFKQGDQQPDNNFYGINYDENGETSDFVQGAVLEIVRWF